MFVFLRLPVPPSYIHTSHIPLPTVLKRDFEESQRPVQRPAHSKGKGENKRHHIQGRLHSAFLHHHEKVRDTRNKQGDHDQTYHDLDRVEQPLLLHHEKTGGAVIPAKKSYHKRLCRFAREPENAYDQRVGHLLNIFERARFVRDEEDKRSEDEERHCLFQIPLNAGNGFNQDVCQLRDPDRRQFEDEIRRFTGYRLRGKIADQQHHQDHRPDPYRRRKAGNAGDHAQYDAELRGAGHAERQEQRHEDPLFLRLQNTRSERRHGIAPQTEYHGQHGLAVQAHDLEYFVHHDREPRQIARVFEDAEGDEEKPDDGQDDRDGVGERHGYEAVVADQELLQKRHGENKGHDLRRPGVQVLAEYGLFQKPDRVSRTEHSHELVDKVEDGKQDRQPIHRMHGPLAEMERDI